MRGKIFLLVGVASLALFAYAGSASALTLGLATPPGGGPTLQSCVNAPSPLVGQFTDDPSLPYHVPPGGGKITQWQTNTSLDGAGAAGAPLTFAVLGPAAGQSYPVVGVDSVTLPNPLPASGIASYTLSTPITVTGGETLALYSTSPDVICAFNGAQTPVGGTVAGFVDLTPPPSTGQTVTQGQPTPSGWAMNVAATLVQAGDSAVTTGAGPAGVTAGHAAVLFSTVINGGPATSPIQFTDTVPAGLKIDSAVAGNGSCAFSGQTVTCTTAPLVIGQSVPVDIVVTPSANVRYSNTVSVANASATTDPNLANNTASATLTVGRLPVARCVVPPLRGVPSSRAKAVLKDLRCKVKITHARSKSVHRGLVVKTKPGKGNYVYGKTVKLVVSSGRRP